GKAPAFDTPRMKPADVVELGIIANESIRELVIVDAAVPDKHAIYKQSRPGMEIVELRTDEDGLAQLKTILCGYRNLDALHVFSHAEDARIYLGNGVVTKEALNTDIN